MKRLDCHEAIQKFGSIPNTESIEKQYPQYVKGYAFIEGETGAVGYAGTEEEIIEACTNLSKFFGIKAFFLYSTFKHHKADWTSCGALIAE